MGVRCGWPAGVHAQCLPACPLRPLLIVAHAAHVRDPSRSACKDGVRQQSCGSLWRAFPPFFQPPPDSSPAATICRWASCAASSWPPCRGPPPACPACWDAPARKTCPSRSCSSARGYRACRASAAAEGSCCAHLHVAAEAAVAAAHLCAAAEAAAIANLPACTCCLLWHACGSFPALLTAAPCAICPFRLQEQAQRQHIVTVPRLSVWSQGPVVRGAPVCPVRLLPLRQQPQNQQLGLGTQLALPRA